MKLLTVVGARPQFVKAAVVSRALARFNAGQGSARPIQEVLVHTGQHYDDGLSAVFFRELEIPEPAHHLGVGSGPHGLQTGRMLEKIEQVIERERPDWVLVYGDTNSTLAGSLAASKLAVPVAHVEAGLRSYRRSMPEEINRVLTDHVSTLLFCPTPRAVKNLSCEGITEGVHLVGDVMYDSLLFNMARLGPGEGVADRWSLKPRAYALATVHRAETTDNPHTLHRVMEGLSRLSLPIVIPLHPRTQAALERAAVRLPGTIRAVPPVSYLEMLALARDAKLILTDSGGLQKEAFWLRVPCVTLRQETEWIETVESGWNHLGGTTPEGIIAASRAALDAPPSGDCRAFGTGRAADGIVEVLAAR